MCGAKIIAVSSPNIIGCEFTQRLACSSYHVFCDAFSCRLYNLLYDSLGIYISQLYAEHSMVRYSQGLV